MHAEAKKRDAKLPPTPPAPPPISAQCHDLGVGCPVIAQTPQGSVVQSPGPTRVVSPTILSRSPSFAPPAPAPTGSPCDGVRVVYTPDSNLAGRLVAIKHAMHMSVHLCIKHL